MRTLFILFCFALSILFQGCQLTSIEERMGYNKGTKLLILHADDLGVAHAVNQATLEAYQHEGITSSSMMVPTPWFSEWAAMVKDQSNLDVGIHITLTAEWKYYRWDGVLPASQIPSLLNDEGFFYASSEEVVQHADPVEVEKEVRAQIERAKYFGLNISHLDSHMGTMFASVDFFKIYLKLGREYGLPLLIPNQQSMFGEGFDELVKTGDIVVNSLGMLLSDPAPKSWEEAYEELLDQVKPGLNEILVHLAYDNSETQGIMIDHPDFGATWRQNDLNTMMSDEFKNALKERNIQLVNWTDVKNIYQK